VRPGAEPPKTAHPVHRPEHHDERDPDHSHPNQPVNQHQNQEDLESIRRAASGAGGRLVMSSFMWLVYPGMVVDPARDGQVFDHLNGHYWPFSYAHMRRFLDFQTRVFRKYAAVHGLDFIDFGAQYPRDPRLFSDSVHLTNGGVHLQAWIMFTGLAPILDRAIAEGTLPRGDARPESPHPAFGPRRTIDVRAIRAECAAARPQP
jgi:hypothetical protein